MSVSEYEEVRRDGARFVVAPSDGHVWPDVEVVTNRNERYWIVEKISQAGVLPRETIPRS